MQWQNSMEIVTENLSIASSYLNRQVRVDLFSPEYIADPSQAGLLLINDGQNLAEMDFNAALKSLYNAGTPGPFICAGIHSDSRRKMEYGVAAQPDYLGRGRDAGLYTSFLLEELLPFIRNHYGVTAFKEKAIAGFSLGGLMALDVVWNHPGEFSRAGIFSGSFWWRSVDQIESNYDDEKHRIMPQEIRKGQFHPGLKFFFQCGNRDETLDRNNNGIIDSIDDTQAVITELIAKGYRPGKDIYYLEMPEGRHDIATWKEAMPGFLQWGWGVK
jgi:enterochelin esterase-like enzyme